MPTTLELFGAPTDVGASMRGAAMGPEALRVAGLVQALQAQGLTVVDAGDLLGPPHPLSEPVLAHGYKHLPEVVAWNQLVFQATQAALKRGHFPLMLGGDHAVAVGSIAAVAQHCHASGKHLRVLWLDAHADFNTPAITPSGNLHGMPAAVLCGHGPEALVSMGMTKDAPALSASNLFMLGVRSVDAQERALVHQCGIEVFDMRYIDEMGMRAVMQQALMGVSADTHHLHLSFDIDGLDPLIAPGVGTPVPGGLSYREAQLCMEMVADTGALASLDIVELNPAQDQRNQTAYLVADLVQSLFGKSTLMRPA